jgi:hypothetical protein
MRMFAKERCELLVIIVSIIYSYLYFVNLLDQEKGPEGPFCEL